ncbi:TPR repeat-containing thioredoxin TDX isoform X1 [Dendrobium catenatum]|uniref:TPR repeat-containing thioredoxin TDX isoform X1 n=1 Tax=Dendrobium catenatum TaxID=906689 RepID=UPI0009F4019D|nr:TPR repeat-containing thioredoxin TDX isoform X1 [Dendrobium catenatum]
MDAAKVAQLRAFVGHCKSDPSVLHDPSLGFFRDYLESLGVQIPASSASKSHVKQESGGMPSTEFGDGNKPKQKTEDDDDEDEIVESDIELEGEVVEPDDDSPQKMGDPSVEVTEENRDAAQMSKAKAVDAISEGKFEDAIDYITEAITLNPTSAILYATRASVFVKMRKPNAAIRDADAALQINSDSAKGYKSRGMAKALLGKWEEAAFDLHTASKLDHDEEIHSVLKMVEPNLQKIEEHHKKYERLKKEREQRKAERLRLRAEAVDRKAESEYLSVLQDVFEGFDYTSKIHCYAPLPLTPRTTDRCSHLVEVLRDLVFSVDPRSPEFWIKFTSYVDRLTSLMANFGTSITELLIWEAVCREAEFCIWRRRSLSITRAPFTLSQSEEIVSSRKARDDDIHDRLDYSEEALRRHCQSSSDMTQELDGRTTHMLDLFRDIRQEMSRLLHIREERDRLDHLIRMEEQRHRSLQQEMMEADSLLAQAMEQFQTAQSEFQTLAEVTDRLEGLKARLF